jgi:hypothetical protein
MRHDYPIPALITHVRRALEKPVSTASKHVGPRVAPLSGSGPTPGGNRKR